MTDFARIRNTFMSNPKGVMDSILSYGLQTKIKSNVRMYFYKYNIYDLVDILYQENLFTVYDFRHTEERAMFLKGDLEFWTGYIKSAGLYNKRFLYDVSLKLPVSYNDFVEVNDIPHINDREFAFILDKKEGYVTGDSSVSIFITTERTDIIDRCVLSGMNNTIKVANPKAFEFAGCANNMILSGLLAGVSYNSIEKQLDIIDPEAKFIGTIRALDFSSKFIKDKLSKLKVDKFERILRKDNLEIVNGIVVKENTDVKLSDIIVKGLDQFARTIKNENGVIKVTIDWEQQTIRSAYIVRGVIFITPVTLQPISYFKELLDSDNVEYILN